MATALISAIPHAVPLQGREPHFTSLQRLRKVFGRAAKTTPSTATQNCAPVPKPKEPTPQLQAEELTGQLGVCVER